MHQLIHISKFLSLGYNKKANQTEGDSQKKELIHRFCYQSKRETQPPSELPPHREQNLIHAKISNISSLCMCKKWERLKHIFPFNCCTQSKAQKSSQPSCS